MQSSNSPTEQALDLKLNSIDPSPHVTRPVELAASCPRCGGSLARFPGGSVAACQQGHIVAYPSLDLLMAA